MHVGKSYKLSEFLIWTRRKIYVLLILGIIPVILYQVMGRFLNLEKPMLPTVTRGSLLSFWLSSAMRVFDQGAE